MAALKRHEKLVRQIQVCEWSEMPRDMASELAFLAELDVERFFRELELEVREEGFESCRDTWLDQIT